MFNSDGNRAWAGYFSSRKNHNPQVDYAFVLLGELKEVLFNPSVNPDGPSKAASAIFQAEEELARQKNLLANSHDKDWRDPENAIHPQTTDTFDELSTNLSVLKDIETGEKILADAYKDPELTVTERKYFYLRDRMRDEPYNSKLLVAEAFNEEGRIVAENKFGLVLPQGVVDRLVVAEAARDNRDSKTVIAVVSCNEDSLGDIIPNAAAGINDCKQQIKP